MIKLQVQKAANAMVRPVAESRAVFAPSDFLNVLGLEGADKRIGENNLPHFSLGDGGWDKRTGGAVAVKTYFTLDPQGRLRSLRTHYLAVQPKGRFFVSKLIELKTNIIGKNLALENLTVLGRAVNPRNKGEASRVLGALGCIHTDIRNMVFPEVAKIMNDFQVSGLISERLHIPGLSSQGGFNFQAIRDTEDKNSLLFVLPTEFFPELLGLGSNDIEPADEFGPDRHTTGIDRQNGGVFHYSAKVQRDGKGGNLKADIRPLNKKFGQPIPDLMNVRWRAEGDEIIIDQLILLGEESSDLSSPQRQKRLGIINKANKDLRTRRYPSILDHIAEYDQRNLVDQRAFTSDLDHHKKMIAVVFGGHNARELLPGLGGTIGSNCTGLFACWRDEGGRIRQKGVLIDIGTTFAKDNGKIIAGEHGSWDYALPNITNRLADIDHIFITHLHADHMQAIIDYARCGMLAGKTVHAAEYDWRVLEQFLKKAKIPTKNWPIKNALSGAGFIDVQVEGKNVLSVYYETNAIPHSTNVTAFIVAPSPETRVAQNAAPEANVHYWSYASLGDMSWGTYNLPAYEGVKPHDTGLKRDFFEKFKEGMRLKYPNMPKSMYSEIDTISAATCDPTSIHREGFSPDIIQVKPNYLRLVKEWFPELGIIVNGLSTAKRGHEMFMSIATTSQRHMSVEGAYMENRFTDMNVMGVNTDVLPRDLKGGNINHYLRFLAGKAGVSPVEHFRRTATEWQTLVRENPGKTFILATGSQGTAIEQDAVGTQVAEGWSRFHLDPKYCKAAYGVDLKNFLIMNMQPAIPGNEETQLAQTRKTAYDHDLMVAVAVHDGTRFYNLKEPYLSRIIADLEHTGEAYTREPAGGLFIHGFALCVPGHGWKEDWRQGFLPWFKENNVQSIWVQHYPRLESVQVAYSLADEQGLGHPKEAISNHVIWTMEGNKFKILGEETPSFILARTSRRSDKYHGETTEYKMATFNIGETAANDAGLQVENRHNIYYGDLGQGDYERSIYEADLTPIRPRRDPDQALTASPPQLDSRTHFPTRGMRRLRPRTDHPHLKMVA